MEVVQGVRNNDELRYFRKALQVWMAPVIHVNEWISQHAMFYVERYGLSHSVFPADALIAATAIHYNESLLTGNTKHYSIIPDLQLEAFAP